MTGGNFSNMEMVTVYLKKKVKKKKTSMHHCTRQSCEIRARSHGRV